MPPKKRSAPKDATTEPAKKTKRGNDAKGKENAAPIVGPGEHNHGADLEHALEHDHDHDHEDAGEDESKHDHDHEHTPEGHDHNTDIPPHDYICIDRPLFDRMNDPKTDTYKQPSPKDKMWKKPASEHPDWPWVTMWQSWLIRCDWNRRMTYCDPDKFGMYIWNDWYGYGLQELQENLLIEFNEEFKKKDPDLKQMWGVLSGLIHWMLNDQQMFIHHDDGERQDETVGLIGTAFLALLNEVDRAGQLKPDSEIRDLALVMVMYLEWAYDKPDYGLKNVKWMKDIVAYAKKGNIDLKSTPVCTAGDRAKAHARTAALKGDAKPDRWNWAKKFKQFETRYNGAQMPGVKPMSIGGYSYDITKMGREQRAKHAFDKVDPLKDIPDKDLKEGNIIIGPA